MTEQENTLQQLEIQRAELDAKIAAAKLAAKDDAIARVRALMAELGVTTRMLSTRSQAASKPSKPRHVSAGKKVPAKYVGPGGSWSGRGLQPKWLKEAIAAGAALESFEV